MFKNKAFTLVELLAVIIILGIVIAIAVPTISGVVDSTTKASFKEDARIISKTIYNQVLKNNSLDFSAIDINSFKESSKLTILNFESLSVSGEHNNPTILLVGKNKWAGLIACGTYTDMKVVNVIEDCGGSVDIVSPTIAFNPNGNATYAKSRSIDITISDNGGTTGLSYKSLWNTSSTTPDEGSFTDSYQDGYSATINSPAGVTGAYYLWVLAKDAANNKTITGTNLYNFDNTNPVLTISGTNPANINVGDTYSDAGASATDAHSGINGSVDAACTVNPSVEGSYTVTYSISDNAGNTATAVRTVNVNAAAPDYIAGEGVNKPRLLPGMTAIKWSGTTEQNVSNPDTDTSWYDYANKQWANAKTADGSYWVWIPRYIYKIATNWHTNTEGTVNIQFTQNTNDNWNSGVIGSINTDTTSNASNNTWTNHPAFTFGSTELTGIWVAKFETSITAPMSINSFPGISLSGGVDVGTMYLFSRHMETDVIYGWPVNLEGDFNTTTGGYANDTNNLDTHMMKNTEWGAVAYLSRSSYGKTTEVGLNTSQYTGGGTGTTYKTSVGLSTTGNIYGIYDMAGGNFEYTAAYVNNGHANLTSNVSYLLTVNAKYKDVYTKAATDNSANNYALAVNSKGDAIYETSSAYFTHEFFEPGNGWFGDDASMPYSSMPCFLRGGWWDSASSSGVYSGGLFDFIYHTGVSASSRSWRTVIAVSQGL